jgi:hypothetical protein
MMTNSPDLPSRLGLLKATLIAALVAAAILVLAVLPAEYGIDPTGMGRRLGLDALASTGAAEVASSPQAPAPVEASQAAASAAPPELDAVGQPVQPVDSRPVVKRSATFRTDSMTVTLPPGEGVDVKARMEEGVACVFHWTASAPVAVDMHGERKGATDGKYTSYWIERGISEGSGSFTAPFEGIHGWYWLNLGSQPVVVKVQVSGFQQELFQPSKQ